MIFNYKVQKVIKLIKKNALTNEFYLTDLVKISKSKNLSIGVVVSNDEIRSRGINDIKTLSVKGPNHPLPSSKKWEIELLPNKDRIKKAIIELYKI